MISVVMDPTVKYHSVSGHTLTCTEKTYGDSIWWVVLVGRYPWVNNRFSADCASKLWRLQEFNPL